MAAAQALAWSPRGSAVDALLAMRADPDASVRMAVLGRAAKLPDATGDPILQTFAADADANVRAEAVRLRKQRAAPRRR